MYIKICHKVKKRTRKSKKTNKKEKRRFHEVRKDQNENLHFSLARMWLGKSWERKREREYNFCDSPKLSLPTPVPLNATSLQYRLKRTFRTKQFSSWRVKESLLDTREMENASLIAFEYVWKFYIFLVSCVLKTLWIFACKEFI